MTRLSVTLISHFLAGGRVGLFLFLSPPPTFYLLSPFGQCSYLVAVSWFGRSPVQLLEVHHNHNICPTSLSLSSSPCKIGTNNKTCYLVDCVACPPVSRLLLTKIRTDLKIKWDSLTLYLFYWLIRVCDLLVKRQPEFLSSHHSAISYQLTIFTGKIQLSHLILISLCVFFFLSILNYHLS